MSRKGQRGMMIDMPTKIRKRGCSSSSSPSSRIYSYRLNKRAILVGKNRAGIGSRSNTPVPTWRTTPVRGGIDSPIGESGKSARPISARRLAATLWEMNEMPSPKMSESNLEVMMKRHHKKNQSKMAVKMHKAGSLPPQLLDPPHSPTLTSQKMVRTRTPSISQRLMSADQNVGVIDTISNASFMEIESRSRPQSSSGSVIGNKSRLKDVSSALTTSKELLTIINRMWGPTKQPSSTISLISALHTELERARLQVNQLIQEQRSDKNEVNYIIKCFAEEKALWKVKEKQAIEAVAGELEVEHKLRRRLESLNIKLGKEVAEIKSSLIKVVKELESEKRAREITEQVCDELARNLDEDRAEVEKEREMLELADKLREERVQMKLSEAKHQYEEKNSDINKLRKQLEVFLRTKREKDEEGLDSKEDSGESDLHSIELELNNIDKGYKWGHNVNEMKARNSVSGHQVSCRSSVCLQRSISDGVEWGNQRGESLGLKNQLPSSRLGLCREIDSPSREKERSWPSRDPCERSKSRTSDVRAGAHSARKSKW